MPTLQKIHLNKHLIEYPEGIEHRTQAIQKRIESANITRKISDNQVRAIRVVMSGWPEDLRRIQDSGQLDQCCKDNVELLQDNFGKENLVSAVLHLDEKTPHIHATIVRIITVERRKVIEARESGKAETQKKKYKKKT